jgi:PHD/YefM family antitoxin component YafN of YafNO toxin-antitoxin module
MNFFLLDNQVVTQFRQKTSIFCANRNEKHFTIALLNRNKKTLV